MDRNAIMNWTKLFNANTGRMLHDDEAALWYKNLCSEIQGFAGADLSANDLELCTAIRYAFRPGSGIKMPQKKFDFTKNHLRLWVETRRQDLNLGDRDPAKEARRQRLIKKLDSIKDAIAEESDPRRIWDLICSPQVEEGFNNNVFAYLERFAIETHPGWERPLDYMVEKMREVEEAYNRSKAAMHDAPNMGKVKADLGDIKPKKDRRHDR